MPKQLIAGIKDATPNISYIVLLVTSGNLQPKSWERTRDNPKAAQQT